MVIQFQTKQSAEEWWANPRSGFFLLGWLHQISVRVITKVPNTRVWVGLNKGKDSIRSHPQATQPQAGLIDICFACLRIHYSLLLCFHHYSFSNQNRSFIFQNTKIQTQKQNPNRDQNKTQPEPKAIPKPNPKPKPPTKTQTQTKTRQNQDPNQTRTKNKQTQVGTRTEPKPNPQSQNPLLEKCEYAFLAPARGGSISAT